MIVLERCASPLHAEEVSAVTWRWGKFWAVMAMERWELDEPFTTVPIRYVQKLPDDPGLPFGIEYWLKDASQKRQDDPG